MSKTTRPPNCGVPKTICSGESILGARDQRASSLGHGRTERHGGLYRKLCEKTWWLMPPDKMDCERKILAECNASKNRMFCRSGDSPLQRVFGVTHRLPAELTSDAQYTAEARYDLAANDPRHKQARRIREAAMKAHAELAIRELAQDAGCARPRAQTHLRADVVVMVWRTLLPSRRGRWVGYAAVGHHCP